MRSKHLKQPAEQADLHAERPVGSNPLTPTSPTASAEALEPVADPRGSQRALPLRC